jgi:glycosyltransferase involved in cell wall biosynthesis
MKEKIANGQPPLLSIITVCLNEPKLERTCESIVNQTFQDFE